MCTQCCGSILVFHERKDSWHREVISLDVHLDKRLTKKSIHVSDTQQQKKEETGAHTAEG
jgi:hypothetical protein